MAGKYAIDTIFNVIDRVSAPTGKVGKAFEKLQIKSEAVNNKLKKDFVSSSAHVDKLGKSIKKASGYLVAAGAAAATAFLAKSVKDAIEFQTALAKVNTVADTTSMALGDISGGILKLSSKMGISANEIASSMYNVVNSGIETNQALTVVEATTKLSTVAFIDAETAIGGVTNVLNAYGKSAAEAEKITNQMYIAYTRGNMEFSEMQKAMKQVIPTAAALGVGTDDVFASISVLTSMGEKTNAVMKSLGGAMKAVVKPSKAASDMARHLGIDFSAAALKSKGWKEFIDDIAKKTGGNIHALEALFGNVDMARMVGKLSTTGAAAFDETMAAMMNTDAVGKAFEKMMDTPEKRWANAMNRVRNSGIKLGEAFLPIVEKFTEKIGAAADRFSQFDFEKYTPTFEKVFNILSAVGSALVGVVKTLWAFRGVIIAIAAPLAAYHIALMAITVASRIYVKWQTIMKVVTALAAMGMKAQTTSAVGLSAALSGLTLKTIASTAAMKAKAVWLGLLSLKTTLYAVAAGIATAAQWALNVALTANPIGVIIMAVAALITLIVILIKNINKITAWVKSNTNKVIYFFTVLLGPIGLVISMIKELVSNWARIKDALAATGLFDKIKEIAGAIKGFFQPAVDWLINAFNTVKNFIAGIFSGIGGIASKIGNFFMPAITAVGNFFKGVFDAIYNFVKPAFDWLGEKWLQIVSFFKDNAIINAIKVIAGTLISGLLAPVQGLLEILSHIPGLGHLAGKGAEKIQEFRNFLKGVDGATITAKVEPPKNVTLTPPTDRGTQTLTSPDFNMAEFAIGGAGGKSKLHGVVDISDGAAASPMGGNSTYTTTAAVGSATPSANSAPAVVQAILNNVVGIAATLRDIDAAIPAISKPSEAIQNYVELPRVNMSGNGEDIPQKYNPRAIAPISQAERTAYSVKEGVERLVIQVAAEKGTSARITRAPRNAQIELVRSGGNA